MVQLLNLRLREQQAAVLLGQAAPARFRLAGQHALLVAVTEHVFDDRLHVLDLRAAFDIVVALHRVGVDDLKIKRRAALLAFAAARRAANFRQRTADVTRVKFVNQTEAVAFVRAERQQRDGFVRIGRRIALGIHGGAGRKLFAFAFHHLHAAHRDGRGRPINHDGKTDRVLRRERPRMRVRAHRRRFAAERHDFGRGRGAVRVSDITFERGVHDVTAAPEIMRRVVHADHADAEFVGELHAGVHRLVSHGLAKLVVAVPDFGGGKARRQLLDLRAGRPAADLAAEQFVEVQRLDGVVRALAQNRAPAAASAAS
jgi:hypothetical protein